MPSNGKTIPNTTKAAPLTVDPSHSHSHSSLPNSKSNSNSNSKPHHQHKITPIPIPSSTTSRSRSPKNTSSPNTKSISPLHSVASSDMLSLPVSSDHGGGTSTTTNNATPIPSLHGNLVRNRTRRDPLVFYETLDQLGEGSMGSVSRVRKRVEVIGGSARAEFRRSHGLPDHGWWWSTKIFDLFQGFFCPPRNQRSLSERQTSEYQYNHNNNNNNGGGFISGMTATDFDTNRTSRNDGNHDGTTNCVPIFFFCPTKESNQSDYLTKSLLVLAPIHEHKSHSNDDDDDDDGPTIILQQQQHESDRTGTTTPQQQQQQQQGCWNGFFGRRHTKKGIQNLTSSDRPPSSRGSVDLDASSSNEGDNNNNNNDDNNSDDPLDQSDYDQADRAVARALKHSTSSLITYGHKEVVYALKSIHLDRISSADFMKELKNEVAILKELDHPHIVKCYETFDYNKSLYLVLEICSGSDLYSRDPYSEQQASRILRSLLSAVAYMHSKNITHRDLKYENIMFANEDPDSDVKIIDFGLSKKYADNSFLHDTVGTVYTMAPELLRGGYTQLADVWSIGVISFMLLSSSMPFYGKDRKQVIRKIVKGHYQFIGRRWNTVSVDSKALVVRLLQHNPDRRPSAAETLEDPWLKRLDYDFMGYAPEVAMMDKVQATIQTFAGYGKLKKLALMLIAYRSTSEEIGYLRKMFERFDLTHNGEVTLDEFKAVLRIYEYDDDEVEYLFRAMDLDCTGLVHYSEFLAATIESHGSISEEQVAECFDRLDNDDNGYITKEDMMDILGDDIHADYIDDIMKEADIDNDKKISYLEFLALWDDKGDAKREQDREDVKKRRHRRADSAMSATSTSTDFDLSDLDSFNDMGAQTTFSFESNEFANMLDAPISGDRRISAMNAFVLEKERSSRAHPITPRNKFGHGVPEPPGALSASSGKRADT